MSFICPVCGYPRLEKDPHYIGSFEICLSCNFQFGISDRDRGFTFAEWRKQWIANGMQWGNGRSRSQPPKGWDPVEQLKNLGLE